MTALFGLLLLGAGCTKSAPAYPPMSTTINVENTEVDRSFVHGDAASSWKWHDKAVRIVNETQGRTIDVEQIKGLVVEDPNAKGVFYFATLATDKLETEVFNGIYRFDSSNLNWERLYKQTSPIDDPEAVYLVAGIENGSLLIKKLPYESEILCASLFNESLGAPRSLVRMPLDAPYSKLAPVDVTQDMQYAAKQYATGCNETL
ncbi:hypothetical protein A3B32_00340 [Candidatus Uhrbacteria bacterium RIFCSPLOWO2_01_FULL_53_9]|uniref:Lipoprotein n=2 Tax=Candidatus Uhriibacteriota TaxID=1752732 RepID=A0A1F7UX99_9BACT|nr:MAG: hypothetical protein A3B32_00340 [Candidatus Uhrbacteria bacterium RIFCSPLOWO2_01_FULL_53_9]